MPTIKQECPDCHGTGLYSGFCEDKDEAVVCLRCEGSGATSYTYKEYTGRKRKPGIKSIKASRGAFIATGVGGVGRQMTYAEFEAKHPASPT